MQNGPDSGCIDVCNREIPHPHPPSPTQPQPFLHPAPVFPPPLCSYSEQLGKWIEVGNSGMFRPEMLRPMGLPEGVNVIAWGLGLER
jgi:hypothetical protein